MEYKGTLQRWNDEKGFGFIVSEHQGRKDVFLHISELTNMSRRPVNGDVILYQLYTDSSGKIKAVNARIEGVSFVKPRKQSTPKPAKNNFLSSLISLFFIAGIALFTYHKIKAENNAVSWSEQPTKLSKHATLSKISSPPENDNQQQTHSNFQCDGRRYCSQMTSCEEAMFFLKNCPDTKMDGDNNGQGDGIPCEDQWCGHYKYP